MKTKLNFAVLAMSMLFFLAIPTSSLALWDSPHEKADKLITEAMNQRDNGFKKEAKEKLKKAREILAKELGKNRNNMNAKFSLAKLTYTLEKYDSAQIQFGKIHRTNPEFGEKIITFYMDESEKFEADGNLEYEMKSKAAAYSFQPSEIKMKKAKEFAETGKDALFKGNFKHADLYFRAVNVLDRKTEITYIFEEVISRETNPKKQLRILRVAVNFANRVQTIKVEKIATSVGQKFKKAKIKKASIKKDLNQLPKSYRIIIVKIAWPPSWKTVYGPVKFTGKGLENKNWIKAVEFGKNYRKGDKLIIKGDYFEVYRDGGWQKCKGYSKNINKTNNSGVFFGVKAYKGKSFTVEVKRYL